MRRFDSKHYPPSWGFKPRNRKQTKLIHGFGVNDSPYVVCPMFEGWCSGGFDPTGPFSKTVAVQQ